MNSTIVTIIAMILLCFSTVIGSALVFLVKKNLTYKQNMDFLTKLIVKKSFVTAFQ